MAVGKEIRGKIKSIENTRKITKAMEMVAASKMRRAQERMRAARPFSDKVRNITANLARAPLATPPAAAGRLRGVRRTLWRRLGETLHSHDRETAAALDELFQHPLQRDAENRLRRAVRNGSTDDDLTTLIGALHRDERLVVASRTGKDPIRLVSSMGVTA